MIMKPSPKPVSRPRVLVTGASGFLGRALAGHLSRIRAEACGIDLTPCRGLKDSVVLDLLDRAALRDILEKKRPEYILHAAGIITDDESKLEEAHIDATRSLLESVRAVLPGARTVIIGSAAEYGRPADGEPVREGAEAVPVSPYGRSKLRQSEMARRLADDWGLDVLRVRLFNTLGPGQGPHLVAGATVERLRKALAEKNTSLDVFDPQSRRDFLDIRDAARLVWLAAGRLEPRPEGPPAHISSGVGTTILDLTRTLLDAAGQSERIELRPHQSITPTSIVGDASTLKGITGATPLTRVSLRQSLRDMWAWSGTSQPSKESS